MPARLYRTQVLLDPEQHKALAGLAARRGESLSQVLREIVGEYLVEQDAVQEQRLAALDRIRTLHEKILARRQGKPLDVDVSRLIEEMREERGQEIYGNITGCRD